MTAAAVPAAPVPETVVAGPVRRMLTLLRPHSARLILAVAAGVAAELATLGLMALAAWLIARASQQPPLAYLSVAIVGVRAFATARGVFRYAERVASHDAALRALSTMRGTVFDALVPLAPTGLPAFRSGDLLSRMVSDVEAVQDLVVRVLVPVATAVVVAGLAVGYVATVLPAAAAALAVGLALAGALVPLVTVRSARRNADRLAPARAEVAARSLDLVHGSADLAVFGATDEALAAAGRADARLAAVERTTARTGAVAAAIGLLVQGLTTVAVLAVAVDAAAAGAFEAVMVPVVVLVALIAFDPVLPLVTAVRYFLESQAAARRVMAVLDARPPVIEPAVPLPAPGRNAVVAVADVTVRYAANRPAALNGASVRLEPGRRIAVVGASGSGKSTLVAALMRFVEPSSGTITWGGHDLSGYAGDDVRAHLTGVTQDAHLFHTTIRENLRLARPGAGDDELRTALDRAKLLPWVDGLQQGLDTTVGESGGQLSGGQRQRLSLARAILADPAVLVLDEPTEGLDPETADALLEDLLAATRERGTLLVTHRLTGLDAIDEVVVLDAGSVVQHGTHAELVEVDGVYRDLWWASHPTIEAAQRPRSEPSA